MEWGKEGLVGVRQSSTTPKHAAGGVGDSNFFAYATDNAELQRKGIKNDLC